MTVYFAYSTFTVFVFLKKTEITQIIKICCRILRAIWSYTQNFIWCFSVIVTYYLSFLCFVVFAFLWRIICPVYDFIICGGLSVFVFVSSQVWIVSNSIVIALWSLVFVMSSSIIKLLMNLVSCRLVITWSIHDLPLLAPWNVLNDQSILN